MARINNVKEGLNCHICHSPASKILRLGHRSVKGIYGTDGVLIEDLSSGYGEDFPYCKFCFESVKEEIYND